MRYFSLLGSASQTENTLNSDPLFPWKFCSIIWLRAGPSSFCKVGTTCLAIHNSFPQFCSMSMNTRSILCSRFCQLSTVYANSADCFSSDSSRTLLDAKRWKESCKDLEQRSGSLLETAIAQFRPVSSAWILEGSRILGVVNRQAENRFRLEQLTVSFWRLHFKFHTSRQQSHRLI